MATILVVDDEPSVRRLTAAALGQFGEVIQAASPDEALAVSRGLDGPIDLVVTDIHMPGMTGVDLAVQVRRERGPLSVLFVSGSEGPDIVPEDFRLPWDFRAKPFGIEDLRESARKLLDIASESG